MEKNSSLISNLRKGIALRLKKIFARDEHTMKIGPVYKKYLKHLPGGKTHTHKLFGKRTWFRAGPDYLNALQEIFVDQVYRQHLPPHAKIIDCGAHIGMSVLYYKRLCPSATVICFEPDPTTYQLLRQNIESHQLTQVEAINKAVWVNNEMLNFNADESMSSRLTVNGASTKQVQACRLADYIDCDIEFLKIDIEGAEYEVLRDIAPRLGHVRKLFIEYHGLFSQNNELLEMLQMLRNANFRFYITEAGPVYPHPFTTLRGNSIYDVQLNIFCLNNQTMPDPHTSGN